MHLKGKKHITNHDFSVKPHIEMQNLREITISQKRDKINKHLIHLPTVILTDLDSPFRIICTFDSN